MASASIIQTPSRTPEGAGARHGSSVLGPSCPCRGDDPLPPEGSVYPTLRVVDAWGVLEVAEGALIASDWRAVQLPGPAQVSGRQVSGPGWTLDLAEGWTTHVEGPGHVRVLKPSAGG